MDLDRIVEDFVSEAQLSHRQGQVVACNLLGLAPWETGYVLEIKRGTESNYQGISLAKCHARSRHDLFRVSLVHHAEPGRYPFGKILEPYKERLDDVFAGRVRSRRRR